MSDEMRAKFQEAEAVGRVDSADLRSSRPTTDTKLDGVGRGRLFVGWIHSLSDSSVPWLFASGHCGSQEPREGTVDHRSDRFQPRWDLGQGPWPSCQRAQSTSRRLLVFAQEKP